MNAREESARKTRRSFLVGGVAAAAGYSAYRYIDTAAPEAGRQWPLRRSLRFNESISSSVFGRERLAPEHPVSTAKMPRENGSHGLSENFDPAKWSLTLEGDPDVNLLELALSDIHSLPRVESVTELKCIEGWSEIVHWTGARFRDFKAKFAPNAQSAYVSMMTPDEEYFVGLDIPSALHPQTLLCYAMNGEPLTAAHGAPLRLVIPVKYGIKSIKRIGTISFTDSRPGDYWANDGYDWYAGL